MKKSVQRRLVLIALIAVGTVLLSGVPDALGQKLTYRQAQYQMGGPAVDLPSAANEASMFPSLNEMVPRSLQKQQPASSQVEPSYESYETAPFSEPFMDGMPMTDGDMPIEEVNQAGLEPISYFGTDGPAPIYSTGSWWWRGNWYTQMDVVVLDRNEPRTSLVLGDNAVNQGNFTNSGLAKLNSAPGTRLTLGKFLGRDASNKDHMAELTFLGLFDWDAGQTVTSNADPGMGTLSDRMFVGNNDLFTPFRNADSQTYQYATDYNDIQMNYRLQTRPGKDVMALQPNGVWVQHAQSGQVRSFLVGLRTSSINEQADYSSRSFGTISQDEVTTMTTDISASGVRGPTTTTMMNENVINANNAINGRYLVRTNNDMVGIHFGGEMIEVHEDWSFGLRGKVGGLVNFIDRRSSIDSVFDRTRNETNTTTTTELIDTGNGTMQEIVTTTVNVNFDPQTATDRQKITDEKLSWVLEAGVFTKYQVRPNLAFRAGYDVMLYSGVAMAAENMGYFDGFAEPSFGGTPLYHGASFGFDTTW